MPFHQGELLVMRPDQGRCPWLLWRSPL